MLDITEYAFPVCMKNERDCGGISKVSVDNTFSNTNLTSTGQLHLHMDYQSESMKSRYNAIQQYSAV